jgi:hypothetical protein
MLKSRLLGLWFALEEQSVNIVFLLALVFCQIVWLPYLLSSYWIWTTWLFWQEKCLVCKGHLNIDRWVFIHLLVYIGKFISSNVCISHEFLSKITYIFSVKLFAIFFIESLMAVESQTTSILDIDCLFPMHLIVRSSPFSHCQTI